MTNSSRTPLEGSERPALPGARRVGDTDPNRIAEITTAGALKLYAA